MYVSTAFQKQIAEEMLQDSDVSLRDNGYAASVISAFNSREKVHHDAIHVVNEYYRNKEIEEIE